MDEPRFFSAFRNVLVASSVPIKLLTSSSSRPFESDFILEDRVGKADSSSLEAPFYQEYNLSLNKTTRRTYVRLRECICILRLVDIRSRILYAYSLIWARKKKETGTDNVRQVRVLGSTHMEPEEKIASPERFEHSRSKTNR